MPLTPLLVLMIRYYDRSHPTRFEFELGQGRYGEGVFYGEG